MCKLLACIGFLLLLGGCESAAQLAARDDAKCQSYGAKAGDPAYVQCRAQLDAARTIAAAEPGPAPIPVPQAPTWHPGRF